MTGDSAIPEFKADWRLEKRGPNGRIFEVLEGGDGKDTRVVLSTPGQPAESYCQGSKENDDHA